MFIFSLITFIHGLMPLAPSTIPSIRRATPAPVYLSEAALPDHAYYGCQASDATVFGEAWYFINRNDLNAPHHPQLWRTDGTAEGTVAVPHPGDDAADRQVFAVAQTLYLENAAGLYYQTAPDAPFVDTGLPRLNDVVPAGNGVIGYDNADTLYFFSPQTGPAVLLENRPLQLGFQRLQSVSALEDRFPATVTTRENRTYLLFLQPGLPPSWMLLGDGSKGPRDAVSTARCTVAAGHAFIALTYSFERGRTRHELWVSDGRAEGTRLLHREEDDRPFARFTDAAPYRGGVLYARIEDDGARYSLHYAHRHAVMEWVPAARTQGSHPARFTSYQRGVAYVTDHGLHGVSYAGDPSVLSTTPPAANDARRHNRGLPLSLDRDGDLLYLAAENQGLSIWHSNGTVTGTARRLSIPLNHSSGYDAWPLADGYLVFAGTRVHDAEPHLATPAGTRQIAETNPYVHMPDTPDIFPTPNGVFFQSGAQTGTLGFTDGTRQGTRQVLAQTRPLNESAPLVVGDQLSLLLPEDDGLAYWTGDGTLADTQPRYLLPEVEADTIGVAQVRSGQTTYLFVRTPSNTMAVLRGDDRGAELVGRFAADAGFPAPAPDGMGGVYYAAMDDTSRQLAWFYLSPEMAAPNRLRTVPFGDARGRAAETAFIAGHGWLHFRNPIVCGPCNSITCYTCSDTLLFAAEGTEGISRLVVHAEGCSPPMPYGGLAAVHFSTPYNAPDASAGLALLDGTSAPSADTPFVASPDFNGLAFPYVAGREFLILDNQLTARLPDGSLLPLLDGLSPRNTRTRIDTDAGTLLTMADTSYAVYLWSDGTPEGTQLLMDAPLDTLPGVVLYREKFYFAAPDADRGYARLHTWAPGMGEPEPVASAADLRAPSRLYVLGDRLLFVANKGGTVGLYALGAETLRDARPRRTPPGPARPDPRSRAPGINP